jgi:sugar phosphate isomerase/epimerase
MKYLYFTKYLQSLDVAGLIGFCKSVGLDGVDMAVRPGYPIHPDNMLRELPTAGRQFGDAGLTIGLVTMPTNLNDPDARQTREFFEASANAGVPAIKIGYFTYRDRYDEALNESHKRMAGFAKRAAEHKVKACYHTHSGGYLGNNCASLRLLLADLDPHHVGAFLDTGHLALNGGPFRMEADLAKPWLSALAIKDFAWTKTASGWKASVVPAGDGIVQWDDVAKAVKEIGFNGTVSLHAEYETKELAERKRLAGIELELLKKKLR